MLLLSTSSSPLSTFLNNYVKGNDYYRLLTKKNLSTISSFLFISYSLAIIKSTRRLKVFVPKLHINIPLNVSINRNHLDLKISIRKNQFYCKISDCRYSQLDISYLSALNNNSVASAQIFYRRKHDHATQDLKW